MRFTAPFIYSGYYVPARARSQRSVTMAGSTVIDVQEVAPGAARLAFELATTVSDEMQTFPKIDGKPARVWHVDGNLYCERVLLDEFQAVLDAGLNDKRNPFSVSHGENGHVLCFVPEMETQEKSDVEKDNPNGLRSWDESDREKEAALIARRASELRIIDGALCVKVSEPCLGLLETQSDKGERGIFVVACESDTARVSPFVTRYDLGKVCIGRRWRLDRKEEVLAAARSEAERKGLKVVDTTEVGHVEPEFVKFADDAEAVLVAADHVAAALESNLAAMPRDVGLAWYALQDALDEAPGRVTPALAAAMERLDSLADGGELETIGPVPYSIYHTVSPALHNHEDAKRNLAAAGPWIRQAVDRWHSRPNDGLEWVSQGLKLNALPAAAGDVFEVLSADEAALIGQKMRTDIASLADAARDGFGHLVVAMSKDAPAAACLCVRDGSGFRIADSCGPLGRAPSEAALGRISEFLDAAAKEADDDMALESLGALQLG